jgi:folate-binding protein YgfZ
MSHVLSLRERHEALGVHWKEYQGWEVPSFYADPRAEWEAVRGAVGLIDLGYHGALRVVGRDRRTWLHGMVTNDVRGLADGQGCYAAILNVQGHMLTDLYIYALPELLLLDLPAATVAAIRERLDGFLMMEQAEIEDAGGDLGHLSLQGPAAGEVVATLGADPNALPPLGIWTAPSGGLPWIARVDRTGGGGFDVWVRQADLAATWDRLLDAARAAGGGPVGLDALTWLRIEAGIPWWGSELDEKIVPFEARLESSAISLHKGCYIGQEVIARIEARGRVNNLLVGLSYGAADPPPPATPLVAGGKTVGRTTGAVRSPARRETVGLGFVRREHAEPGTRLTIEIETTGQEIEAVVAELPFVKPGG